MNINYLIEYIYLAEMLSFRKAADYFYVSRSVISRHLAAIEETLGTKLVDRGNHSVQLTEAGKVFYREARTVLRAYANAVDRTREAGHASGKTVRVGYLKNAARPVIVRFVRYMHHEHPDMQIDAVPMEFNELRRALEDGGVDVALAMNVNPSISRNYRSTPVYSDQFYAVVSKEHPLASRVEGVELSELLNEKLLLPDSFSYAGLGELIDELVQEQLRGDARASYSDMDTLYLKVQAEGYVALSSGLNNTMFGDRLVALPIRGVDASLTVSAFYAEGFSGAVWQACRKGFESCQAAIKASSPVNGSGAVGITIADVY